MTDNLDALLAAEAEHAENHKDAPIKPGTRISRPGGARAKVLSVRLTEAEAAALEAAADRAGSTPSALVRDWITDRLISDDATDPRELARALESIAHRVELLTA